MDINQTYVIEMVKVKTVIRKPQIEANNQLAIKTMKALKGIGSIKLKQLAVPTQTESRSNRINPII